MDEPDNSSGGSGDSRHRRSWALVERVWALVEKVIMDQAWSPFVRLLILLAGLAIVVWLLRAPPG